jgi:hypothetical protein
MMLGLGLEVGGVVDTPTIALAEEHPIDLNAPDEIRQRLEQQLGKRVKQKIQCYQDITIDELAAVNSGSHYQEFIYIKTKPSVPSGLYDTSHIQEEVTLHGYAGEEFALFRGRPITRAEYDDGAAVIEGNVIDLNGEARLRERYLTPYNLIIAPHESPINTDQFYELRADILNRILRGEATVEELTSAVLKLLRREYYHRP